MAAKTVLSSEAGNGAFKVTITYDDVTLSCTTVNYDLTAGTAIFKFSDVLQISLSAGIGKTVPFPSARLLSQSPLGQGFIWSP